MIRFLTLLFFALLRAGEATPGKPNFQDDILPIFDQSCNSCHNPDKAKGSLILSTINGVMHGGSSGKVVVPEDGKSSLLYQLAARLKEPHMPPRGQGLETEQVKLLKRWIDQGLLPTSTGKAVKKKTTSLALDLKTKDLGSNFQQHHLAHLLILGFQMLQMFVYNMLAFVDSRLSFLL